MTPVMCECVCPLQFNMQKKIKPHTHAVRGSLRVRYSVDWTHERMVRSK